MKQIWNGIQIAFAAFGGFLGWFLGGVLRTAVIFFYLSNEGISILENSAHLGLPIPAKLKEVLEQLHERGANDNESK